MFLRYQQCKAQSFTNYAFFQTRGYLTRTPVCTVNHQFFKTWTPENAYIFGFLCADGCITANAKREQLHVKLQSSCKEGEYISKLAAKMHSTYKVSLTKDRKHCCCSTTFGSHKMALDLISKGCLQRKSQTLQWPKSIPIHNQPILSNFILGYFDSDGCAMYVHGSLRIGWHLSFSFSPANNSSTNC